MSTASVIHQVAIQAIMASAPRAPVPSDTISPAAPSYRAGRKAHPRTARIGPATTPIRRIQRTFIGSFHPAAGASLKVDGSQDDWGGLRRDRLPPLFCR